MNWISITQKMAFFIVTAVKTSNLTEREVGGSERHYGWGEQNL
jgi:hypothetical protein